MTLFNLGGEKKKHEQALRFISEIKGHPEPLRVEIENTPFQFYSKSTVRAGLFVLTIPISIQQHMKDGGWVRMAVKNEGQEDLRIQVANQEKLELGTSAKIFCRLPTATIESRRRSEARFFTGNFRNLLVDMGPMGSFPILDFSCRGMRIPYDFSPDSLTTGKPMEGSGTIRMGARINVALESLVPRFQGLEWVGLEFSVGDKRSEKILAVFLDSLDQKIRQENLEENV